MSSNPASEKKLRILVMDDEQVLRLICQRLLTKLGHEVFLASDGQEAIDLHEQHLQEKKSIDLFILDLTIPNGLGGAEAITTLLKQNPKVRAIAISGHPDSCAMKNPIEHGFCKAISKPFDLSQLRKTIAEAMVFS